MPPLLPMPLLLPQQLLPPRAWVRSHHQRLRLHGKVAASGTVAARNGQIQNLTIPMCTLARNRIGLQGRRPMQPYAVSGECTRREAAELAPAPHQDPLQRFPMKCYTFWLFQSTRHSHGWGESHLAPRARECTGTATGRRGCRHTRHLRTSSLSVSLRATRTWTHGSAVRQRTKLTSRPTGDFLSKTKPRGGRVSRELRSHPCI